MKLVRVCQGVAGTWLLGVWAASALAYTSIPALSIPEKMIFVSSVGVGKITSIEAKTVKVRLHPAHSWLPEVRIANIQDSENVFGLEKQQRMRLGFINIHNFAKQPELSIGHEGVFFAVKH